MPNAVRQVQWCDVFRHLQEGDSVDHPVHSTMVSEGYVNVCNMMGRDSSHRGVTVRPGAALV